MRTGENDCFFSCLSSGDAYFLTADNVDATSQRAHGLLKGDAGSHLLAIEGIDGDGLMRRRGNGW